MLFVNKSMKNYSNPEIWPQPDTGTTCCAGVRLERVDRKREILMLKGRIENFWNY
jgi:hypothetical protein